MPTTNTRSSSRTRTARVANRSTPKSASKSVSKASNNRAGRSSYMTSAKSEEGSSNGHSQLEKLFTDSLKDIYWAEKHLTKALPKMRKKATTDELKSAIEEHVAQTKEHVSRLEQIFEMCGKKAKAKKCEAMQGLVEEGNTIIEETEDDTMTRDAGIIMAAQKVEHYEIATYGSLVTFAKTLGMEDAAEILEQTLEEEKETDQRLTRIAEGSINQQAKQEKDEDNEEDDSDEQKDREIDEKEIEEEE